MPPCDQDRDALGGDIVKFIFTALLRVGACLLASLAANANAAALPSVEAFAAFPAETAVVISPDGRWLAWCDQTEAQPRVVMFDVQARKTQRVLAVPEQTRLRALNWVDGETLLITVSETRPPRHGAGPGFEAVRTIAHDVSGGVGRMLMAVGGKSGPHASLIAARTTKPKTVIMASYYGCKGGTERCLYEVDTRTGVPTPVAFGNPMTVDWVVDADGRAVAREDWDWRHHVYRVFSLAGEGVKEIYRHDDSERPILVGLSPERSSVVLLAANGRAHVAAWALPLDGATPQVFVEDPSSDITGVLRDPNTGVMAGVFATGEHPGPRWVDPGAKQRAESLQRSFSGRIVWMTNWSADGQKVIARVETDATPPVYYLVDFAARRADIAAEEYPTLAKVPMASVHEISYSARDGAKIPAYLTLPPGISEQPASPLPMVVLPHEAPDSRDYALFNWIVQFFASRGYAVLQPQFRGSSGFGEAFREAGMRQWGGLMQDDVTDGVRAMIEQHVADRQHICIVGENYAGYVALAGVAFTPDLYACAVSIGGASDLPTLIVETAKIFDFADSTNLAYWKAHLGALNDRRLVEKSPLNAVAAIKAPVLLIHATADRRIPFDQSEKFANALKAGGKKVTLVRLEGEDDCSWTTKDRVRVMREIEEFLRANLTPRQVP